MKLFTYHQRHMLIRKPPVFNPKKLLYAPFVSVDFNRKAMVKYKCSTVNQVLHYFYRKA